jgi:hypothetical protein
MTTHMKNNLLNVKVDTESHKGIAQRIMNWVLTGDPEKSLGTSFTPNRNDNDF